jgi:NAD+ kinase
VLAAGGKVMDRSSDEIQYLIREHMIERQNPQSPTLDVEDKDINNRIVKANEKLHVRWNSQRGRIFIDGSHLVHDLELGDEIMIDNTAPPLKMFRL